MELKTDLKIKKLKINFIVPGLGDSGGIRVVDKYCELLRERGHDVEIYSPILAYNLHRYNSNLKNIVHQIYCTIKTIPYVKKRKDRKWVIRIKARSIRPADITIATMWATAYDVVKLPEYCGKKVYFIQGFEVWDNKNYGLDSYKLQLIKIVISSWINEQLDINLHIGPFPVINNGLDLDIYHADKKVERDYDICLMLNHTMKEKGVSEGIKAFEIAKKSMPQLQLIMFGMNDETNLPSYVEYHRNPTLKELIALYSKAGIFLFPSIEEGWGLAPLEAMACGCVVVGSRTGFTIDFGRDGENMLLSQPGDVESMAFNIIKLNQDVILKDKIQRESKKVLEYLDWKKEAKRMENLFYEIAHT